MNFFKKIGNTGSLRYFFVTQLFFLVLFSFLGFYFGVPICDKSASIDCNHYLLLAIFLGSLAANILLQFFQNSDAYADFQAKGGVEKITGVLEILLAPVVALAVYFIYQFLYGWSNSEPYLGLWHELFLKDFLSTDFGIKIIALSVAAALIVDGVRRVRSVSNEFRAS